MTQEKENKTLQSNERTDCVKVAWYLIGNCSQSADETALLASAGGCFAYALQFSFLLVLVNAFCLSAQRCRNGCNLWLLFFQKYQQFPISRVL